MRLSRILAAAIAAGALTAGPAGAQVVGPPVPTPRVVPDDRCREQPDDPEEIVVCGQDSENSPYRIPRALRNQGMVEDRHVSWDTQVRDMEALERFSSQNVGPAGMSQHGRQVDCEWRAARQIAAGRRPDCGRGRRPGE